MSSVDQNLKPLDLEDLGSEFGQVLVIDDDEVARNLIINHLQSMGVTSIVQAEDGDIAWKKMQRQHFHLVVLDWKLPKLSGLALFNRMRRRRDYATVPVLVVSGLLEKNDFRLLQEFPCSGLLEKPFTQVLFQNRIQELQKETLWYEDNGTLVDTIMGAVHRDPTKIEQLLKQVLKTSPNPVPLALLAGRRLSRAQLYKPAQKIFEGVLAIDGESVVALNELGKIMHWRGMHKDGLDLMRRANHLSPQNLQRLCMMGEAELNLSDPENARAYFANALAIDPADQKAEAGMVVAANMEELLQEGESGDAPKTFASLLNTIGISYVRNGHFAKGIEQYQSALPFLHSPADSARVTFNLGLGFLRWGKPKEALPWFQRSKALAPQAFSKSEGYVRQLLLSGTKGRADNAVDGFAQLEANVKKDVAVSSFDVRPPSADESTIFEEMANMTAGGSGGFAASDEYPEQESDDDLQEESVRGRVAL